MNLFEWVGGILAREAQARLFGEVRIIFIDGKIDRVVTEKTEKPPLASNQKSP